MYCLRCKEKTPTEGEKIVERAGRQLKKGKCKVCGAKKAQFAKASSQSGAGWVNEAISKLPIELHYRSPFRWLAGQKATHSFTGPGTKLEERLDKNGNPVESSRPVNLTDHAALLHDKCYSKHTDTKGRHVCDKQMEDFISRNVINNKNEKWYDKADGYLIRAIIGTKRRLGLGKRRRKVL